MITCYSTINWFDLVLQMNQEEYPWSKRGMFFFTHVGQFNKMNMNAFVLVQSLF